jgi:hypothetical protein
MPYSPRAIAVRSPMQPAAYLITYRDSPDPARRANLHAVLGWLARQPSFDVVVVEQDSAPRLDGPLPHPSARVVFAYNPGPFNKSWGLNLAARCATAPLLAFGDADVIVGSALGECLGYAGGAYAAIKPYRRLVDLDEADSARVRGGDYDWVPPHEAGQPAQRERAGERLCYAGGVVLLTRALFQSLGGWDERFRGWGGEDDALSYRLERARTPALELDRRPAVHLQHARPPALTRGQPHYAANLALLRRYRDYSDAQLARLAEVQHQFNGCREKYQPEPRA